jgi:hypothetical protein
VGLAGRHQIVRIAAPAGQQTFVFDAAHGMSTAKTQGIGVGIHGRAFEFSVGN